ncbi:hypothetical protein M0805_002369 [Coniferiporia weirii]|nr:hypothetical protein M0805_002369 [Coniferiporia weirii]
MDYESTHPLPMPPFADRFEYETDTSSLSDYDSEWTQISGTEDDSDFPHHAAAPDRPLSRAGTIDGSIDGDVWEGPADGIHCSDELTDETRLVPRVATDEAAERDAQSLSTSVASRIDEDNRINDALNCSVMGTLRASRVRSVTSSLHASLTDSQSRLRLSFPDPLVSSRDDLSSGSAPRAGAVTPTSSTDEYCENFTEEASSSFADVEAPTLVVSEMSDEHASAPLIPVPASCILSLVLYGSASLSKWHIAERVMALALQYDGETPLFIEEGTTRCYYFDSSVKDTFSKANEQFMIRVADRTSSAFETVSIGVDHLLGRSNRRQAAIDAYNEEPSLALILLPSRLPSALPKHTYYLPLISPPSLDFGTSIPVISSSFSEQVMSDSAQYAWERLEIANECLIALDTSRPNEILDVTALESLDRITLADRLSVLFDQGAEASPSRASEVDRLFANKWYTLAFVAATILAITIGGVQLGSRSTAAVAAVNGTNQSVETNLSASSANNGAMLTIPPGHRTSSILHTGSYPPATITAKALMQKGLATSIQDALVLPPCATGLAVGKGRVELGSATTFACSCHSESLSPHTDRAYPVMDEQGSRDLMIRPVTAVRVSEKDSMPLNALLTAVPTERRSEGLVKGNAADNGRALSVRVVENSLALISTVGKALAQVAGVDMLALHEAIDELLQALRRQTDNAKGKVKAAHSLIQTEMSSRNARAKESAKKVRRAGELLLKTAGERLRIGTEEAVKMMSQAREGAKRVRKRAAKSRQSRRTRRRRASLRTDEDDTHASVEDVGGFEQGQSEEAASRSAKRHRTLMRRTRVNDEPKRRDVKEGESGGIFGVMMEGVF